LIRHKMDGEALGHPVRAFFTGGSRMNRETKVGLITGLAIIVMVGMLLSSYLNHQSSSIKLANLSNLGSKLRHSLLHPVSDQTIPPPSVAPKGAALANASPPSTQQPNAVTLAAYTPATTRSTAVISMPGYTSTAFPSTVTPRLAAAPQTNAIQVQNAMQSQTTSQKRGQTIYTVIANDTLTRIAQRFYHDGGPVAIERIIRANPGKLSGIKSVLRIGEKLRIPPANNQASIPQMMAVTTSGTGSNAGKRAGGMTYRVKPGDTLYGIAALTLGAATRHNIDAIKKANGISNDRDLRVGEKLHIP